MTTLTSMLLGLAVKGGLLLLLALGVDVLLRRASAATRHAHWQLALGGTLVLALLALAAPLLPQLAVNLPLPVASGGRAASAENIGTDAAAHAAHNPQAAHATLLPHAARHALPPREELPPALRVPLHQRSDQLAAASRRRDTTEVPSAAPSSDASARLAVPGAANEDAPAAGVAQVTAGAPTQSPGLAASVASARSALARPSAGEWLVLVWTAGAALVLALLASSLLHARALARAAQPLLDPDWLALLERTARELSLSRRVTLLVADGPVVPLTWGHRRPVVLLPADCREWSAPRRRQVLLHELAHIRRGDWLTQILAQLSCALYWYQPLAWLGARRLRQQREHACDDRVLAAGNRASDYAGHLLDIARTRQTGLTGSFATLAMARPSQLEGRLLAVLDERRDRRALPGRRTLAAAAVAGSLVLALACVQPKPASDEPGAAPSGSAPLQLAVSGSAIAPTTGVLTPDDATAHAPAPGMPTTGTPAPGTPAPGMPAPRTPAPGMPSPVMPTTGTPAPVTPTPGTPTLAPRAARSRTSPSAFAAAPVAWTPAPRTPGQVAAPAPLAPEGAVAWPSAVAPPAPIARAGSDPFQVAEPVEDASFGDAPAWELAAFPDWEDDEESWTWSQGEETFRVTSRGWLEPDETGTQLESAWDDALLVIEHTHGGGTDRIEVRGVGEDDDGNTVWSHAGTLGGAAADAPALQAEFARLLPTVLAHTAMFTERRVRWLMEHGGVPAVLAEAAAAPTEAARAEYYADLLQEHDLGAADIALVLAQLGRDLPGSALAGEVLADSGPELLADPDLIEPLFGAVDAIESDSVQAEVLHDFLHAEFIDDATLARVLDSVASGIESDACAAEVLASVPAARLREPGVRAAYLRALESVESDAAMAEVFASLFAQRGVKGELLAALLDAAARWVDSDAALAELLEYVPQRALADERVRAGLLAALESIDSDSALAGLLAVLVESDELPAAVRGELLDAAARGVESDSAMAHILMSVPADALGDSALRARFDAAFASIDSRSYREEVLEELGLPAQAR